MIINWIKEETQKNVKLTLLFRKSRDGLTDQSYVSKVYEKGPTLNVIKTNFDKVIVAFTMVPWKQISGYAYAQDNQAFIGYVEQNFKAKAKQSGNNICHQSDRLVRFAGGKQGDLSILNEKSNSYFNLGTYFHLPPGYSHNQQKTYEDLIGSKKAEISIKDLDCYLVEFY